MHFHVPAGRLLGSVTRRFIVYALAPFAIDAFVYGACRAGGLDAFSAALVAKFALLALLLLGLLGGTAVFMTRGDAQAAATWEVVMRVLLASSFVAMLAFIGGTAAAMVAESANRHDVAVLTTVISLVFAVGALAFAGTFAVRAFELPAALSVPSAIVQATGLALLGALAPTGYPAVIAACASCLVLIPLLRLFPPAQDTDT